MAVDLFEYVESLRREISPPGSTVFAEADDEELFGYLVDAFWEARLDGFVTNWQADVNGVVTPLETGGADLPREQVALIVLYAGIRVLRNKILNTNTSFRAHAGPAEFEVQNSATMLAEMLRQLQAVKDRLLEQVEEVGTDVALISAYEERLLSPRLYGVVNIGTPEVGF